MSDTEHGTHGSVNRRKAVGTLAATAGAMAIDWRASRAFAQANADTQGANSRIGLGFIGCGGMGTGHLRWFANRSKAGEDNTQIVAVCDIYEPRKNNALNVAKQANPEAKVYHDYTDLLADPGIDAVIVASPEHWHAQMCIDALKAGKDVYCEKPFTRYMEEAKAVRDTVRAHPDRIFGLGAQFTSDPKWGLARQLLPEIGKVVWSQTSYCRNQPKGEWNYRIDPNFSADTVDWKRFLGPLDDRPLSAEEFFRWRKYWPYSSGICGDLFPHKLYQLLMVLGEELPSRVVASGGIFLTDDRDVPDTFHMLADYPSKHTIFIAGSTIQDYGVETVIRGNHATMELEGAEVVIKPQPPFAEEVKLMRERPPAGGGRDHDRHRGEWLTCLRTRKPTSCPVDLAYQGMVALDLAERSYRQNKAMLFDPEKETILG